MADLKLLPPANPDTVYITSPFGSHSYVFDITVDHIQFLHKQGKTEYGLLCWLFKLNGAWCGVVGKCDPIPEDDEVL